MSSRLGVFAEAPLQPPTVIFNLSARCRADPFPKKLDLGVGAYRDESLKPFVFDAVKKAEHLVINAGNNKEYLPIVGLETFRTSSARLLFGADASCIKEKRIATSQSLSGTGALTLSAHLIKRLLPGRRIFASNPTWENHGKVVADAGAGTLEYYRYWNPSSRGLDLDGMLEDLKSFPKGSIILIHAVAHNPTGVDPTRDEWKLIADAIESMGHFPWFDIAYQGFASGNLEEDAWALRYFENRGFEMIVCQSFAKNMGLYCERVGAIHVVTKDSESSKAVLSNIETIIRPMYSNPPAHGARVASTILNTPDLENNWRSELQGAMDRIKKMRYLLRTALEARKTPGSWEHITRQIGMFSFLGLTPEHCHDMVEIHHIYMLNTGRINVAGLNEASIDIVADAIHAVVTNTKNLV